MVDCMAVVMFKYDLCDGDDVDYDLNARQFHYIMPYSCFSINSVQ